jgi:hypothetical protein
MSDRTATQCDGCGQVDDHPKLHFAGEGMSNADTYHHDCIPYKIEKQLLDGAGYEDGILAGIIKKAKAGTHGNDLLAHIQKVHKAVNA